MGSRLREKDQTTSRHQPHLSSLVVRPSISDGYDGEGGGRSVVSDYEPGKLRRDGHRYSRCDRYFDDPGCRIDAGSASPICYRDMDHRYSSDFGHSGSLPQGHEFSSGKDRGKFRDFSPPYSWGRVSGRPLETGFDGPGFGPRPLRVGGISRINPKVRPREGDWICSNPQCGNLNFARREYCNNCKRLRYGLRESPRRGYPGPPPLHSPPRRFPGPPFEPSPGTSTNGYRSPRGWARDGPRDFGLGSPPPSRHGGRFSDFDMRRDRPDHQDVDNRWRNKFDRPMPLDWNHGDHGRDSFFNERKGFERRLPSPPLPPSPPPLPSQSGQWARDVRVRSRSPVRGALPPKDYHRDVYMEQRLYDRRRVGHDRMGDVY